MPTIPAHFNVSMQPAAHPAAVVQTGAARFTLLTDRLLRLEWEANGRFENRASQAFWYRRQPTPPFSQREEAGWLHVETDYLHLQYRLGAPFTPQTLTIRLKQSDTEWQYGDEDLHNLRGTTRTLDMVSGSTQLEPGLLSRAGWVVVDDGRSLLFNDKGWLTPRKTADPIDLYFFGYGLDFKACLRDYTAVTGPTPLLPRWALGNWWSRYWAYTQDELTDLMRDFRAHDVPLSVCIVDIDWHLPGWTGYTWNKDLFPDPPAFIAWLHAQGLKTALNLHPADGIGTHEAAYPAMAARLGVDAADGAHIPFDIANPDFVQPYFELLHHPQEADGVDFWWMDWQQGEVSGLPGLDPLWWLNHLHFYDLGRDGQKRPFVFSRWGGLGNHRYPIGFSGDTYVNWETLAFQPYFTSTAANVGYGWWSHDIGGHMRGVEEGALYARWVQFGVFSPILRLHSTNNPFHDRRPWGYDADVLRVTRDAMQLRHALIPYLYTMSWRNATAHEPPVRPMYHDYPQQEAAYCCPQQYTFGTELIAAPYTAPADADTQLSRQVIWLPPGDWFHFFSGEYARGDSWLARYGALDDVPVFARAGAIVPLGPRVGWGGVANPEALDLHIFAGADNAFTLYEDDGETQAHQRGAAALTTITQQWQGNEVTVTVDAAAGDLSQIPAVRQLRLLLVGVKAPDVWELAVDAKSVTCAAAYDGDRECFTVGPVALPQTAVLTFTCRTEGESLLSRRDRTEETVMAMLRAFRMETAVKHAIAQLLPDLVAQPERLAQVLPGLAPAHLRALLEVTQQAGIHHVQNKHDADLVVLWNNRADPAITYRYANWFPELWQLDEQFRNQEGIVPRFLAFTPSARWQTDISYSQLYRHQISAD